MVAIFLFALQNKYEIASISKAVITMYITGIPYNVTARLEDITA
jgi:hypothetical protein